MQTQLIGILTMLVFILFSSGCQPKDIIEECNAITINTSNFFKTNQRLIDHCQKGDGVDYIIEAESVYGYYEVEGELVIEDGVTIVFKEDAGLSVRGTGVIKTLGTSAKGIVLRGESNNNIGTWKGVYVESNKSNSFSYTTIKGGGGDSFNSNNNKGNLIIYAGAKIAVNNCQFMNSPTYGVNIDYYTNVDITSFMSNHFLDNGTPLLVRGNNANIVDATNRFSNNTNNYVQVIVGTEIRTAQTWQALEIPYRLYADGGFTLQEVGNNGSLTIAKGATVEFESQTGFKVNTTGAFIAKGTSGEPITFRGSNATAGYWNGIQFWFTQNPLNEISYANIEHAGSGDGAIYMWADPKLTIKDVSFKSISSCAFYDAPKGTAGTNNPKLTQSNNTYTNVGSQYCKGS